MKKMVIAVLFMTALMAFMGCEKDDGKIKVVFWHAVGGRVGEATIKLVDEFNASQDRIVVEAQYQGNYDDAITKLRATRKGQGPDVMQLYDIGSRWAIDSGLALKMQDFIDMDNYDISDYEPNILAYYTIDGELYSMPFNCSSPVIVYNKEALARAGLNPTAAFATMDACLESGRAMSAAGIEVGGSFTNYSWVFEQLVGVQGMNLLDNGNGRTGRATEVTGSQGLLNIFTKLNAIARDPSNTIFGKGTAESKNQFATGTVGYIVDSSSIYTDISSAAQGRFTIGFAPVPKVNPSDTGGTSVGGASLWIMDNGKDERAAAAWEFIKFVTGAQQQAEFSMATGYIPVRRSSIDLPFYQEFLRDINPEIIVAINSLQNSTPESAGALMGVFPKARQIIENEVEAMMNNPTGVSAQTIVDTIVNQINAEIALYNRTN